jgi:hypothetical protein
MRRHMSGRFIVYALWTISSRAHALRTRDSLRQFDNGGGDASGDQWAEDWHDGVSPVGIPFAANRQNSVRQARTKISGGVHRVAGGSSETQADRPHQSAPQFRTKSK